MVLQHGGHVRGVSAPHERGLVQSVLLVAGQLLGTTGPGAMLAAGKATKGFQRTSWPSYRDTRVDLAELSLPFYIYRLSGLHHA